MVTQRCVRGMTQVCHGNGDTLEVCEGYDTLEVCQGIGDILEVCEGYDTEVCQGIGDTLEVSEGYDTLEGLVTH